MIKNLKLGKRIIAGILAATIIGSGTLGFQLYKKSEVNRVKGYLEDFLTEDNYVDLSKISSDYDIRGFNGEYLDDAMEDIGVKYVRITDTYVYDGAKVTPFKQMCAVNYDNYLWTDKDGNDYYEMYEPIRHSNNDGVFYEIPDGFVLQETDAIAEPLRYEYLDESYIEVVENDYDESYSLFLNRKK